MKNIAIYGFGGLGRELATIIRDINLIEKNWNFLGYFDDGYSIGAENRYGKVLGGIDELNAFKDEIHLVFAIANGNVIKYIYDKIINQNIQFPNIIAPNVQFFDYETVAMGIGNVITNGCRVSCDVQLGDFNIINGCVSLGHEVALGSFNVLMPDTRLSGKVCVGDLNFFGARSFIYQLIKIGTQVRVAAGSYVMRNTKDNLLYLGNPAKIVDTF